MIQRIRLAWGAIPRPSYLLFLTMTILALTTFQGSERVWAYLFAVMHVPVWMGFYYKAVGK